MMIGGRMKFLSCIALLCLGSIAPSIGQSQKSLESGSVIRLGVEEVRLDAVVLDRKGRQVTNLTVDDFELRQGGVNQKLTSAIYINESQAQSGILQAKTTKVTPPPASGPMLTQKEVGRTFAFVVDNIRMDFLQFCNARTALKKFVQNQMEPGDLVAIVPTFSGSSEYQTFTSNKQHLLAIIDNLEWMERMNFARAAMAAADAQMSSSSGLPGMHRLQGDNELKDEQYMAIAFCIKALNDVPGRKSLILISTGVWIKQDGSGMHLRLLKLYNDLADVALRAGVVVHTLDLALLAGPEQIYDFGAENTYNKTLPPFDPHKDTPGTDAKAASGVLFRIREDLTAKKIKDLNARMPVPLSEKTGGLLVADSNFPSSLSGIGRASEMIKGYYLLTYVPPANTFDKDSQNSYTTIQVKVKRSGCEVHTRNGFFREPEASSSPYENVHSLQKAMYSPFRYNDLKVDIASGYFNDSEKGGMLQSSVHLDIKALKIDEAKEGMQNISLEGLFITSNIDNVIQDSSAQRFSYSFKREDIPWIREHGLRFSIKLPVKKPGAYYVRAAMKDLGSGKIGSAYQFIQVPDLKKSRLALSSIFVVHRNEDLPWVGLDNTELVPDVRKDSGKSTAIQIYAPGDVIEYAALAYCAEADAIQMPDLVSQYVIYRDGKEFLRSDSEAVDLYGVSDLKRLPIRKKLVLDKSFQPGDYILALQVRNRVAKAKDNKSIASQALSFKIQ
jgi:VWFA-related protein